MCIVDRRQQFIATVENKFMAAVVHDIIQIQNNGLGVKTNFSYNTREVLAILCLPALTDAKRISQKKASWGGLGAFDIRVKALEIFIISFIFIIYY